MMTLREPHQPGSAEATENLRIIRDLMERSTRYSTFSGLSGVLAGTAAVLGAILDFQLKPNARLFLVIWSTVLVFTLCTDYLLTKRKAAQVGKHVLSRLGKQMVLASAPGLGLSVLLTWFCWQNHILSQIYPLWMLCYGVAVCSVGLFSQSEVSKLGRAFLLVGAVTLFFPAYGLHAMALSFGGFHIVYGVLMGQKNRW